MMRSLTLIAPLLIVLALSSEAVAQKSWMLTIASDVKVGDQILKKGEYKVRHEQIGGEHFLSFYRGRDLVAKVPCTPKKLDRSVDQTMMIFRNEGGVTVLKELRFSDHDESFELKST